MKRVVTARDGGRGGFPGRVAVARWALVTVPILALGVLAVWFLLPRGPAEGPLTANPADGPAVEEPLAEPVPEPAPTSPPATSPGATPSVARDHAPPAEARVPEEPSRPPDASLQAAASPGTGDGGATLSVPDFGVGTGVVDRRLVGGGVRFPEGDQVSFLTRVLGGQAGDTIAHVWLYEGRAVQTVRLRVRGPHWRTYSRKTLFVGMAGSWAVEARDASGRVLARQEFSCVPGSGRITLE